nr:immunoglobulin heavy chain junction region [Mus musculus]
CARDGYDAYFDYW